MINNTTVNFDVDRGEFVSLVGLSVSGKLTCFRIIAGLESATLGAVRVDGIPITDLGPDRGKVFQDDALFPWWTVAKLVFEFAS